MYLSPAQAVSMSMGTATAVELAGVRPRVAGSRGMGLSCEQAARATTATRVMISFMYNLSFTIYLSFLRSAKRNSARISRPLIDRWRIAQSISFMVVIAITFLHIDIFNWILALAVESSYNLSDVFRVDILFTLKFQLH